MWPHKHVVTQSLEALHHRRSHKWRTYPADVLPVFDAEMDFDLAPGITAALNDAVARGECGYAWTDPDLTSALSGFVQSRFGWHVDPADVIIIPSVSTGITGFLRRLTRSRDKVAINSPAIPSYFRLIAEADCRVVEAPLARDADRWVLDLDLLRDIFAQGVRIFLLCNPHNPTGRVFVRAELLAIVDLAEEFDVIVFSDETLAPLVLPGACHVPLPSINERAAARCVAFVSAANAWNIPGLTCAQAVVSDATLKERAQALVREETLAIGSLGVVASTAAYRDCGEWLDGVVAITDRNRWLLRELLGVHLPNAGYQPPEGGHLAWIDCTSLGLRPDPASAFLDRGRVALHSGLAFGTAGAGWVRASLATSPEIVGEMVRRMAVTFARK
jgi:cystathionine beta-lyase